MSHLSERAGNALELSDSERARHSLHECFVRYPAADRIIAELNALLIHPRIHRMPNRLLVGETNNGKTALIRHFMAMHPPMNEPGQEAAIFPLVYIQAPPVPEEHRFYAALLDAIDAPHRHYFRTSELFYQARNLLPKVGLKLLIIDEIHHVLAGSTKKHSAFLNTVKYLGNELMVPLIGVGTEQALFAVQVDRQIENRFQPFEIPRWKCSNDWRRFLATFERELPLRKPSNLANPLMAQRLHLMSEGTVGELSYLLMRAMAEAIRGGEERICDAVLDRLEWVAPSARRKHAQAVI
jgi:Bacterial TniB protein